MYQCSINHYGNEANINHTQIYATSNMSFLKHGNSPKLTSSFALTSPTQHLTYIALGADMRDTNSPHCHL